MNKRIEFTYNSYIELITKIKNNGYQFISYNQLGNFLKEVIIRHDIDFCLEKALEMAIIENSMNIKATYFILITSPFYNIHEKKSLNIINKILSLGHSMGLHFDLTVYETEDINLIISKAMEEINVLSIAINRNVDVISMHRPSKFLLEANVIFPNSVINTYSKKYFSDIKYISDSRMNWKNDPFFVLNDSNCDKIQILIHPIWYNHIQKTTSNILNEFYMSKSDDVYANMKANFTNISEFLKPISKKEE